MAIARLRGGMPLDARGVEISEGTLARFLNAMKDEGAVAAVLPKADFGNATFTGRADFSRVTFTQEARFSDAVFRGELRLTGATFRAGARFRDAGFAGNAVFDEATFETGAYFTDAVFERVAGFERATIQGPASFLNVEFKGPVSFANTLLASNAHFGGSTFEAPAKFGRTRFAGNAYFRAISFAGSVDYSKASFERIGFFEQATFEDEAEFRGAGFASDARFHGTTFKSVAGFKFSRFQGPAVFREGTFDRLADFKGATFGLSASFSSAHFHGPAHFGGAVFERETGFDGATFEAGARFAGVRFEGEIRFDKTTCRQDAGFQRAAFRRAREFGPIKAAQVLLDGAVFRDHVRIEIDAKALSARGTTFASGTHLRVRGADVFLEDADFVRQATLLGVRGQPRLISVRGAHVAPLVLSDIDLRSSSFFGAHGLESMRIEASCRWPSTPSGWWTSRRETIAEEHRWRQASQGGRQVRAIRRALKLPAPSPWLDESEHRSAEDRASPLAPAQIATVYRALRKAREDNKDEAGAGDLYYGEMEMRRHAGSTATDVPRPAGERAVLLAYWLASGYGLRALRALACLVLVLLLGAALLCWFGFRDPSPYDYGHAVLFATESSISVLRPPETNLSGGGQAVQICLRLLGPLFFGLALLAVRARVKR